VTDELVCDVTDAGGARLIMRKFVRGLDEPQTAAAGERAERRLSQARGTAARRPDLSDLADADG
jgi:hypothetical protein